ncbi:MAG TPA: hypothetical protein VFQ93_15290 [Casimicrobiaceae bacterium]|nr:hypothetical protein [Casimicrobiaceae bacterium]
MNDKAMLRALLVWGIPFVVVVAALGYETDWGRDVTPDRPAPAKVGPSPVAVALLPEYGISGGVDARSETVERSLFNPTRRPAPPATPAAQAATQAQHGQYTLTGTTVFGNVATAFLREVKSGKSHTVHAGESLNDVNVAEVKPDVVKLKHGDDVEELRLKIASGPKSTVQVAPPAPPANQPGAVHVPGLPGVSGVTPGTPPTGSTQTLPSSTRPVAPPPTPSATGAAGVVSVGELLAQRRRAAAQAAAEGRTPPSQQ